jgi:tripartite-type tricarboxylate transporter receptor subunit TctC
MPSSSVESYNVHMPRCLLAAILFLAVGSAPAAWPEKPIRFVVPSAPGGSVDILMRVLTQQLSAQMGVGVVENKPGGAFVPGTMDTSGPRPTATRSATATSFRSRSTAACCRRCPTTSSAT